MVRLAALLLTALGLAASAWLIGATGARQVFSAIAGIGAAGFLVLCAYSGLILVILGAAWFAVAPGLAPRQVRTFIWARTTREAATDVLPFSQLGGLVIGARTVAAGGVPEPLVLASFVADLTTELAAQLLFTLFGVGVLVLVLAGEPVGGQVLPLAFAGLAAMAAIMAGFAWAQRPLLRIAGTLGSRLFPGSVDAMGAVRARLDAIYRERGRVLAAFGLHLLAWVASAAGAWIALAFIGVSVPLWAVVTIEALVFTLRSVAFVVPGALGVQEAAYLLIGPLFGVPPTAALALSLIKRARDLAIGVPALIAWQHGESRALRFPRA